MGIWSSINSGVIVCTFSHPLEIVGYNIYNNNNNNNNNIRAKVWSEVVMVVVGGGNEGEGGEVGGIGNSLRRVPQNSSTCVSH